MAFVVAFIERERRRNARIIRRRLRDTLDPFDVHEHLFVQQYRFTQNLAFQFIEDIRPHVGNEGEVSIEFQILAVLNFYATGSYQSQVGASALNMLSQPMVSRYVSKYTDIIVDELMPVYIRFPQTPDEIARAKLGFQRKFRNFPGIIGVIDCTHVTMSAVLTAIETAYLNRKNMHSINTQIVCNADMVITNMNSRYPGRTHDALIFSASIVNAFLEVNFEAHRQEWTWLIGDSGYPLLPWLMTIVNNANLTQAQNLFNRRLLQVRNIVERCIGVLKLRFRCILKERYLRYHPTKVSKIILACGTLHNYLIFHRFDIMRDIVEDDLNDLIRQNNLPNVQPVLAHQQANAAAIALRNQLIAHVNL